MKSELLDPEVFVEAAELILTLDCMTCCAALDIAAQEEFPRYLGEFRDWFLPPRRTVRHAWWDLRDAESRAFALLLMAEILRDEFPDPPAGHNSRFHIRFNPDDPDIPEPSYV